MQHKHGVPVGHAALVTIRESAAGAYRDLPKAISPRLRNVTNLPDTYRNKNSKLEVTEEYFPKNKIKPQKRS